eukprot:PhM_4_TR17549/c0_g1_i1/m.99403
MDRTSTPILENASVSRQDVDPQLAAQFETWTARAAKVEAEYASLAAQRADLEDLKLQVQMQQTATSRTVEEVHRVRAVVHELHRQRDAQRQRIEYKQRAVAELRASLDAEEAEVMDKLQKMKVQSARADEAAQHDIESLRRQSDALATVLREKHSVVARLQEERRTIEQEKETSLNAARRINELRDNISREQCRRESQQDEFERVNHEVSNAESRMSELKDKIVLIAKQRAAQEAEEHEHRQFLHNLSDMLQTAQSADEGARAIADMRWNLQTILSVIDEETECMMSHNEKSAPVPTATTTTTINPEMFEDSKPSAAATSTQPVSILVTREKSKSLCNNTNNSHGLLHAPPVVSAPPSVARDASVSVASATSSCVAVHRMKRSRSALSDITNNNNNNGKYGLFSTSRANSLSSQISNI